MINSEIVVNIDVPDDWYIFDSSSQKLITNSIYMILLNSHAIEEDDCIISPSVHINYRRTYAGS